METARVDLQYHFRKPVSFSEKRMLHKAGGAMMKILVVDDSKLNLEFEKQYLLELVNEEDIILCSEPLLAKNIVDQENIDVILLDVIMPEVSGFDILKTLRADSKCEFTPIIMLTSLTDEESFVKSFNLGASDFITKPINKEVFKARINVALRLREKHLSVKNLLDLTAKQNLELKDINQRLTEARISLLQADKMAAIGHLAAGVAHEMNTPLAFVGSNFEMLKNYFSRIIEYFDFTRSKLSEVSATGDEMMIAAAGEIDEKYRKLKLDIIRNDIADLLSQSMSGIKRVADIVLSLRTFSHSNNDNAKSQYNLSEIMNQVLLMSRNEAKYIAHVSNRIPEDMLVYCNQGQLAQVFMNIMINAIQAIKSQNREDLGHIDISAEIVFEYVCIHIRDDGPGVPESDYNKIFNPFFTTKEVGKGSGLGLSITYDIVVNKHNGKIEFTSVLGNGTEFIVKIPIALDEKYSATQL